MKEKNIKKDAAKAVAVRNGQSVSRKDGFNPDDYVVVKGSVDSFLLFTILTLLAFGLIMVFSASYADAETRFGDSFYFIKRYFVLIYINVRGVWDYGEQKNSKESRKEN